MSTLVELVKRNFELGNEMGELKKENARLREALEEILIYGQYPSSKIANKALEKPN